MLAKNIPKDPDVQDSFRALAEYIAAARDEGEKLDHFWMVNCDAGEGMEDLDLAIREVEAAQALNTRAGPGKSYHLVVSFQAGEEPTSDQLEAMEREFAKALGFEEHQRIAAAHRNTDHYHFHVAYNRIHKETLKAHTPWNDYIKLEKTARKLEKEYGLSVDLGMSDYDSKEGRQADKGRTYEAMTWEQSFQGHVLEQKDEIRNAIGKAKSWKDAHAALDPFALELKRRGNGLVFVNTAKDGHGEAVKASVVGRDLSYKALLRRLGPFEPKAPEKRRSTGKAKTLPARAYRPKPITRHPGQKRLWRIYTQQRKDPFLKKAFRTWKQFLYLGIHDDPLAMAIVLAHRGMINTLLGNNASPAPGRIPNSMKAGVAAQLAAAKWSRPIKGAENAAKKRRGLTYDGGAHLLPLQDARGTVWAFRAVHEDGMVATFGETKGKALFHLVDGLTEKRPEKPEVVVATDLLAVEKLHRKTGKPVAVTFDGRSVKSVAASLRKAEPERRVSVWNIDTLEKYDSLTKS